MKKTARFLALTLAASPVVVVPLATASAADAAHWRVFRAYGSTFEAARSTCLYVMGGDYLKLGSQQTDSLGRKSWACYKWVP